MVSTVSKLVLSTFSEATPPPTTQDREPQTVSPENEAPKYIPPKMQVNVKSNFVVTQY